MNQKKFNNIRNAIDGYFSIEARGKKWMDRQNSLDTHCPAINNELSNLESEINLQLDQMSKLINISTLDCLGLINLYSENRKAACNEIEKLC